MSTKTYFCARASWPASYTDDDIQALCRYLASVSHAQDIHFLWRTFLPDPKDDLLLELAVAAGARCIITHNLRHFSGVDRFSIRVLAPRDFLRFVSPKP